MPTLPSLPPYTIRARILSPLASGGFLDERNGVVRVGPDGRIESVGPWSAERDGDAVDLRGWLLLPGLIDLHMHLPQLPNAGVGAGLDLLTWLERYIFPLEAGYDAHAAEVLAPQAFRALAAAGTTTALIYGAIWEESLDVTFQAAETHGIRAVIGKVMMDRVTYDDEISPRRVTEVSLRQSAALCERWHGRDDGRLRYAFTPRFAVSCTAELLRESARLAKEAGAYWQTHVAEDRGEMTEVARLFPDAQDYLAVYEQADALGPRTILAHAIHLSEREIARMVETDTRIAHCPASNLFLASGAMPLARYREAGIKVGLGSDVAGGPELALFASMRAGAYTQNALSVAGETRPRLDPLGWLRMATLDGAAVLGQEAAIGSIEAGKEADLIVIDPEMARPVPSAPGASESEAVDVVSRLIFRPHPQMVRGAWVRGRLLDAAA